jgi:NAD(P)-dependent dehydrogenase (short-subunit alcohol dehydrogenase family)
MSLVEDGQPFSMKGRRALVTGATRGIGKAVARSLALAGLEAIAITSRSQDELDDALTEILEGTHTSGIAVRADHSEWQNSRDLANAISKEMGRVDVLINNAGTGLIRPIGTMSDDEWRSIMELNLFAPMALARALIPDMKARGWGRIVNMASLFAVVGKEDRTAYCASKGALVSFSRALAVELATSGITVNAVGAGPIRTSLTRDTFGDPERRAAMAAMTPMNRWGEPEEVAGTVLLLSSDAGSYITGQLFLVDGGASIW